MNAAATESQIWQRFNQVFRNVFRMPELLLTKEMSSWDIPSWDSIMHIQIILALEMEFKIRCETPEILGLEHVGDLFLLVLNKTSALRKNK